MSTSQTILESSCRWQLPCKNLNGIIQWIVKIQEIESFQSCIFIPRDFYFYPRFCHVTQTKFLWSETGLLGNYPIFFVFSKEYFSPLLFKIKIKTVFKGRDWLNIVVELRLQYCTVQNPENNIKLLIQSIWLLDT